MFTDDHRRRRRAPREDKAYPFFNRNVGIKDLIGLEQGYLAEIEMVRGNIHRTQLLIQPVAALDDVAGQETEGIGPLPGVLHDDKLLEGIGVVRRKGVHQLLYRRVDALYQRQPQQQVLADLDDPLPDSIGGDHPHHKYQPDEDEKTQAGDAGNPEALQCVPYKTVDIFEEPGNGGKRDDQRGRDKEARNEFCLECSRYVLEVKVYVHVFNSILLMIITAYNTARLWRLQAISGGEAIGSAGKATINRLPYS